MLVAAKTYALISEYALICDMRLIMREYGIFCWPCKYKQFFNDCFESQFFKNSVQSGEAKSNSMPTHSVDLATVV